MNRIARRLGKPLLAMGLALLVTLAGFVLLPSASADRTPVLDQALPSPREGTSAVATPEGIYLFGGYDDHKLDDIIHYNPATGTLTTMEAKLPSPRTVTAAVWDGSHAYVFGGWTADGYLDEILRYDPQNDQLETMQATLPSPRAKIAAAWDGSHAYLFGGSTHCNPCESDEILRYDPEQDLIETREAKLPRPNAAASAAWTGSHIVIMGGFASQPHERHDDIFHYDPTTDTLTHSASQLPGGRSHASGTSINGYVYHFGGLSCGSGACDTILRYDPQSETLAATDVVLESPRQLTSSATFEGHAYIFGGSGTARYDQILRFSPDDALPPTMAGPVIETLSDVSTHAGQALLVDVKATHPADQPLTLTADAPASASFSDHGDGTGSLEWTPTTDQLGDHDVTITASDGHKQDTESFTIIVNPADAPVIESIGDRTEHTDTQLAIPVHATDPQDRPISFDLTPLPANADFTDHGDGDGIFEWGIGLEHEGEWEFTVTATADGKTSKETFKIHVKRAVIVPHMDLEDVMLVVNQEAQVPVQATHPYDEAITLSAITLPGGAGFVDHQNGTGTLTWTPTDADLGEHEIPIRAATSSLATTKNLEIRVVRELDLRLDALDPPQTAMSPGETRSFPTRVVNTGYNELTIDFDGALRRAQESGWDVQSPEPVTLSRGEEKIVDLNVTAPAHATATNMRLTATGSDPDGQNVQKRVNWIVDVPVEIAIKLDRQQPDVLTVATEGIRVTVEVTWADGSPARDILLHVAHRFDSGPSNPPLGQEDSHEGKTDSNGHYSFALEAQNPTAALPGDHTIITTAIRGDRHDSESVGYTVTL